MAQSTLFSKVVTDEELEATELETSRGGGYVKKNGVYPMTIEKAFLTPTKKGGVCVNLHFGGDNIFNAKLYPANIKKEELVTSYVANGKRQSYPDYKILKQMLYVTNGKAIGLKEMDVTEEDTTYTEYGKEITVASETCNELVGKNVMVGVRLSEKYAWDAEANDGDGADDKTQLKTNSDGDIMYDMNIYAVYSQTGKTPTEIIKKQDGKEMEEIRTFLEGKDGIKKVKLEAVEFEEDEVELDLDDDDKLDF